MGLGYGTDTGVRGRGGMKQRWVNSRGHHYSVDLLASQIKYSLTGQYIIPGKNPNTDFFALRVGYTAEDSDSKDSQTALVGISKQRNDGKWQKITSLDYQQERFTFSDETQTTVLLMPGLNWTYVDADNPLNVSQGVRLNLQLRGAHDTLLSDVSFIQAAARSKWIHSLSEKGRLILRGDLGSTLIEDNFDAIPASIRFFTGGDRTVRGYSLDSIGPRDEDDEVIGGKHMIVGSLEYDYRFVISGVLPLL